MQESLEEEGDSKLKWVSNGGQKRAWKVLFPLGKKAPFIGTQNLTVFLVFATISGTTAYWSGTTDLSVTTGSGTGQIPLCGLFRAVLERYRSGTIA